ncbi:MAG: hypothetical protein H7Y11_01950, partial [Armatimonadetes bacterium]|nr:hypothetical protein [Anaerolineae bacterium]
ARLTGGGDPASTSTPTTTVAPSTTPTAPVTVPPPTVTADAPTATATPASGSELVINGGMETDAIADNIPDGWVGKRLSQDKRKCDKPDKPVAYEGICGFRFKGGTEEKSQLYQDIALETLTLNNGDTLTLRLFVNTSNAAINGNAKVSIRYTDTPEKTKFSADFVPTTGYTSLQVVGTLLSGNVSRLRVQLNHKSPSGKILIDAVSLQHIPTARGLLPIGAEILP